MSREIDGMHYYETREVCQQVGISQPTLNRWLKRGVLASLHRDRKGWRLFTEEDIRIIDAEVKRIHVDYIRPS